MAKVKLISSGMAELLKSAGVRADIERRARRIEAAAKASAPVASGAHRDSIHVVMETTDRARARIVADSDHSLAVESRTGHMARAADAAGGS